MWSDEAIDDLISSYVPHECLWDVSCDDYKDQTQKALAYDQIDEIMISKHDFHRIEYTKKWMVLRGQFLRELRRERPALKHGFGMSSAAIYKSQWRWYPQFEFLKRGQLIEKYLEVIDDKVEMPIVRKRKLSNKPPTMIAQHPVTVEKMVPVYFSPKTVDKHSGYYFTNPLSAEQSPEYLNSTSIDEKSTEYFLPKTEISPTDYSKQSMKQMVANRGEYINNKQHTTVKSLEYHNSNNKSNNKSTATKTFEETATSPHDDEESLFGKMVATTLRKFNPYQKVMARKKIQDIIFEIEIENTTSRRLNNNNNNNNHPN